MGIMNGAGYKLFSAARFKADYHPLSQPEIEELHKAITGLLQTQPNGPFQALSMIVGSKQAQILGGEGRRECIIPDAYLNAQPQHEAAKARLSQSPRKRTRQMLEDEWTGPVTGRQLIMQSYDFQAWKDDM
jgi:hypothetical protein